MRRIIYYVACPAPAGDLGVEQEYHETRERAEEARRRLTEQYGHQFSTSERVFVHEVEIPDGLEGVALAVWMANVAKEGPEVGGTGI
jgi:hypothetical protein